MSSVMDASKTWIQRDFGLDKRLIKALSKLGFTYPTLVQARCIPIALQGKDLLVRARTGSGKTAAFSLPLLHKLLTLKQADSSVARIQCLVLAPTKELCKQIEKNITDLIYYCKDIVTICALTDDNATVQQFKLQRKPDIVVSTPARLVQQIRSNGSNAIDLSHIKILVIDEADLVLSFGYTEDVHTITSKMPKIFQGLLMSATLSPELDKFKRVLLHSPAVLRLEEERNVGNLLQFYLTASELDKYLILFVFIKLGLLQGKGLIFVNDVNKCYKLKLFLQQFFISAAVLNAQVPLNSRMHILEEFNRGVFDYLIATDASIDLGEEEEDDDDDEDDDYEEEENNSAEDGEEEASNGDLENDDSASDEGGAADGNDDNDDDGNDEADSPNDKLEDEMGEEDRETEGDEEDDEENEEEEEDLMDDDQQNDSNNSKLLDNKPTADNNDDNEDDFAAALSGPKTAKKQTQKKKKTAPTASAEGVVEGGYGVARGIDFQGVNFVINFDFPKTAAAYTHRIGRTARAGASGTALSFLTAYDPSIPTHAAQRAARVEVKGKTTQSMMSVNEIATRDAEVLSTVRMQQPRLGTVEGDNILAAIGAGAAEEDESRMQPAPLNFNMAELESFRYRVEDIVRSVTPAAVKEFRTAELKREVLNSAKLKTYFAENPNDLKVLRHDKAVLHPIQLKEHLKFVPQYLIPHSMRSVANTNASSRRKKRKRVQGGGQEGLDRRLQKSRMKDPLLGGLTDVNADNSGAGNDAVSGLECTERGEGGGDEECDESRVFTETDMRTGGLGRGISGRQQWKMRHKKGKFNTKRAKKAEHRLPGSFVKSKNYK